jgi:hypothetical protein
MRALRVETAVSEDGVIEIRDLPFKAGEKVEVIVLERTPQPPSEDWRKLRGSVTAYDRPTEPVGVEDWDALK